MALPLLQASYKGVPFHTKNAHETVGRRLVKHEFPNSEEWFVEDLGIKLPSLSVTAYLSTNCEPEIAYLAAEALIGVCQTIGPGPLILPPSTFMVAHCESCKRSFDKDIQGYMAFDLDFLEEGDQGGMAPFQVGLAVRLVAGALDDAIGVIADIAGDALEALFAVPEALMMAGDIAGTALMLMDTAAQIAVVSPSQAAGLSVSLDTAVQSVTTFQASGTPPYMKPPNKLLVQPAVMAKANAPSAYGRPTQTFVAMIRSIGTYFQNIVDTTTSSAVLASNIQQVMIDQIGVDPAPNYGKAQYPNYVYVPTDFSNIREQMVDVVGGAVRIMAAITMTQAYATATYETRQEAQKARGLMVATVEQVIYAMEPSWPGDHPAMPQLIQSRDQASAAMLQTIADLQPTVQMSLTESMPALYLAWRIYQDPNRAQELADRNDAPHPMWMPVDFEARGV